MVTNLVKTPRIHRWRDVMQSEGICVCGYVRLLVFGCTANDGCALCNVDMTVIQIHEATLVDFSHANVLIRSQRLPPTTMEEKNSIYSPRMTWHTTSVPVTIRT